MLFPPMSCNKEDKKAKTCHVDLKYGLELSETLLSNARKSDTEAEAHLKNWHCFIKDSIQWCYDHLKINLSIAPVFSQEETGTTGTFELGSLPLEVNPSVVIYYLV